MPKSRRTNQQKPKAMIDEQQAKTASYAAEQSSKLLAIQEPKNYIEKESYQCAETLDKADCLNSILQPPKNVSSEKIDPQLIQQLISKTVKHTNHRYRCVAAKRRVDDFGYRQEKVFKRLRDRLSIDRFKSIRNKYWEMNIFQQRQFVEKMEMQHHGR
tara:strand:+ start:58 stop:531 length:474 start_codon:yes stop_codon:yes gene_type:complete